MIGGRSGGWIGPFAAAVVLLLVQAGHLWGQALPAATGAGRYIAIGGSFAAYRSPYNDREVAGYSAYADVNLTRRFGIEAEARRLRLDTDEDTRSATYLIGPRVSMKWPKYRPYAKALVGTGQFTYPFGYAHGSYFAIAPGAGLDISVLHGRAYLRVIDFEYEAWRQFTFGSARPYGFSSGISVRVF